MVAGPSDIPAIGPTLEFPHVTPDFCILNTTGVCSLLQLGHIGTVVTMHTDSVVPLEAGRQRPWRSQVHLGAGECGRVRAEHAQTRGSSIVKHSTATHG